MTKISLLINDAWKSSEDILSIIRINITSNHCITTHRERQRIITLIPIHDHEKCGHYNMAVHEFTEIFLLFKGFSWQDIIVKIIFPRFLFLRTFLIFLRFCFLLFAVTLLGSYPAFFTFTGIWARSVVAIFRLLIARIVCTFVYIFGEKNNRDKNIREVN